ncbi:MAG: hypothetical protein M1820_007113 [Bogoriella megaspora]|nr:MAG: hypothetical protein M1820_007113 [Bogoriella megaspora]
MNPSSVAALADSAFDVANLAKQVRDAACQSLHIDGTASQELLAAAQDLILSLQRPEERLISIAKAPVDNVVLRVAIDIDLFSKFGQGTKSAGELAEVCGVDKVLLVRLMRTLTALEIYKEVDTEVYASSNLSDVLVDPTSRAVYNGMATTAEIMLSLPCYLRHNSYANPATFSVPLFHFSINDPSASYFKWLETHPRELAIFTAYQAATAELLFKEVEPLLERLIKQAAEVVGLIGLKEISNPLQEQRRYEMEAAKPVLLVDIGSGKGETTRKVCGAMLDVIGEGRVILQDLPGVVEKTEKMYRVEAMAHDFFEEQPIRGMLSSLFYSTLEDLPYLA